MHLRHRTAQEPVGHEIELWCIVSRDDGRWCQRCAGVA
jgi:hypothetical protein